MYADSLTSIEWKTLFATGAKPSERLRKRIPQGYRLVITKIGQYQSNRAIGGRKRVTQGQSWFSMKYLGRTIMRSPLHVSILIAATLGLASSTVARPLNMAPAATESTQVIEVRAKKYEFNPSPIRVKQGTRLQLKITATDHVHGFRITEFPEGAETKGKAGLVFSSPQECRRIEKGQTETIEFVAQTPGTYPFKCCVHCGWDHRGMKGKLIVEP